MRNSSLESDARATCASTKRAQYDLAVSLGSARHASVVQRALDVDAELRPDVVQRTLVVRGRELHVHFESRDVKALRTAVSSFHDFLKVAVEALTLDDDDTGDDIADAAADETNDGGRRVETLAVGANTNAR